MQTLPALQSGHCMFNKIVRQEDTLLQTKGKLSTQWANLTYATLFSPRMKYTDWDR